MLRRVQVSDFETVDEMRAFIIASIRSLRRWRQKGVVADFASENYDPELSDFVKIGGGSLGGKARGLAFVANLLRQSHDLVTRYPQVTIQVPHTLVITTAELPRPAGRSNAACSRLCASGERPFGGRHR